MELTKELIADICNMIEIGMQYPQIAEQIGITEKELKQWIDFGERLGEDSIYAELVAGIQVAEANKRIRLSQSIQSTIQYGSYEKVKETTIDAEGNESSVITETWSPPDAHLALKMLERMDPDNWASENRVIIELKTEDVLIGTGEVSVDEILKNLEERHRN